MSWINSVIKDTKRELKRLRQGHSKKERALLQELSVVELYIKNAPLAKKRRAMKSRDLIIAKLRELRK